MPHEAAKALEDVREAAQFVLDDIVGESLETFLSKRRFRNSVVLSLVVIGEAMRRLSDTDPVVADRISGRRQIIAFRNVLIHAYDIVDDAQVWEIVQHSLPTLRDEVVLILAELGDDL